MVFGLVAAISFQCLRVVDLLERIHIFVDCRLGSSCVVILDFFVVLERGHLTLRSDEPLTRNRLPMSSCIMLIVCRLRVPVQLVSQIFGLRLAKTVHEIVL